MESVIVINEQHKLLPIQDYLLRIYCGDSWETFTVPAGGMTIAEQVDAATGLVGKYDRVIFVSPVPVMLAKAVYWATVFHEDLGREVWVFVNERREKKELPDGRVISTLAQDGWELFKVV
jgi:hypothetical protein